MEDYLTTDELYRSNAVNLAVYAAATVALVAASLARTVDYFLVVHKTNTSQIKKAMFKKNIQFNY